VALSDVFVLSIVLVLNTILVGLALRQKTFRYGGWMKKPFTLFLVLNMLVTLMGIFREVFRLTGPIEFFQRTELISMIFATVVFCGSAAWLNRPIFEKFWWKELKHVMLANPSIFILVVIAALSIPAMLVLPPFYLVGVILRREAIWWIVTLVAAALVIIRTDVYLMKYSSKQARDDRAYTRLLMGAFDVLAVAYLLVGFVSEETFFYTLVHIGTIVPLMAMLYIFSVPTVLEKITPSIEKVTPGQPEFELDEGRGYLGKRLGRGYDIFAYQVFHGVPGLCITKVEPNKIRARHGLKKTPVVWMSFKKVAGALSPLDLDEIKRKVVELGKQTKKGVVFLDCFDVIKTVHGFKKAMSFIRDLKKVCADSKWTLLMEVDPTAYSPEQIMEIERELEVIDVWM